MAKTCRYCGTELDEATFCLNEGEMVQEIMALQKEVEAKDKKRTQLSKAVKALSALAVTSLLPGGYLSWSAEGAPEKIGFGLIVGAVVFALAAFKFLKDLKALD
jgi:formate/nitrite transporter FocA (FNT family)